VVYALNVAPFPFSFNRHDSKYGLVSEEELLVARELLESTYLLYMATRSPLYQRIGIQIIDALNLHTRVNCGFATVHNVVDKVSP